jgi:hypothetical protein
MVYSIFFLEDTTSSGSMLVFYKDLSTASWQNSTCKGQNNKVAESYKAIKDSK